MGYSSNRGAITVFLMVEGKWHAMEQPHHCVLQSPRSTLQISGNSVTTRFAFPADISGGLSSISRPAGPHGLNTTRTGFGPVNLIDL